LLHNICESGSSVVMHNAQFAIAERVSGRGISLRRPSNCRCDSRIHAQTENNRNRFKYR
jgi:hypothetical protein